MNQHQSNHEIQHSKALYSKVALLIRGVLFDMDGVLVDSEKLIAEAAKRMFAERYGLMVSEDEFTPFVGAGENRYIGGVAAQHGIAIDIEKAKAWTYEIYGQLARQHALGMRAIPGAVDYVRACKAHGLMVACARQQIASKCS